MALNRQWKQQITELCNEQKNKRIKRILLVDDEYDVSLVTKLVLEKKWL
jgi:hypothetical protein